MSTFHTSEMVVTLLFVHVPVPSYDGAHCFRKIGRGNFHMLCGIFDAISILNLTPPISSFLYDKFCCNLCVLLMKEDKGLAIILSGP